MTEQQWETAQQDGVMPIWVGRPTEYIEIQIKDERKRHALIQKSKNKQLSHTR